MFHFDNMVVRYLAGASHLPVNQTMHLPLGSVDASTYALAKAVLARFALVLTLAVAQQNASAASAAFRSPPLQWEGVDWVPSLSSQKTNHHHAHTLSDTDLARLRVQNRWDLCLYEHARLRYDALWLGNAAVSDALIKMRELRCDW